MAEQIVSSSGTLIDGSGTLVAPTVGTITMTDAKNIVLGSGTGTKIGTATTQKLGFFNSTPIVQGTAFTQTYATASHTMSNPTAVAATTTAASTSSFGYTTAAQADAITAGVNALIVDVANNKQVLNGLIDDLQALGLIA